MDREVVVVTKVYYGVPGIIPIGKLPQVNQQNCPSAVRKLSPRVLVCARLPQPQLYSNSRAVCC